MKTTVLHAGPKQAAQIAYDLLSRKTKKGEYIFSRQEIPGGFEIVIRLHKDKPVVFRYMNDNGRHRFDYDEQLLSFS